MRIFHLSDDECPDALSLYDAADVLVTTGDLRSYCVAWLRDIPQYMLKPAFGVYGNHDVPGYLAAYGIEDLHDRVAQLNGLTWGGFQGCLHYRRSPFMFTEQQATAWVECFPTVDILLLHVGPQGMLDDPRDDIHRGSSAVRRYVLEHMPRHVFVGHQYSNSTMQIDGTTVHRTYGGRLIEI